MLLFKLNLHEATAVYDETDEMMQQCMIKEKCPENYLKNPVLSNTNKTFLFSLNKFTRVMKLCYSVHNIRKKFFCYVLKDEFSNKLKRFCFKLYCRPV